jgi:hypothetical protein
VCLRHFPLMPGTSSWAFPQPNVTDPEAKRRIQNPKPDHMLGLNGIQRQEEINIMKSVFPILAAAVLLLGASAAEAARPMGRGTGNSNITTSPPPPLQSSLPPPTNSGALGVPQTLVPQTLGTPPVNAGGIGFTNPAATGVPNPQSFGALPGNPGSPTYDPNAALPSLNNQGSALTPTPGTSGAGFNTPSTGTSSGM